MELLNSCAVGAGTLYMELNPSCWDTEESPQPLLASLHAGCLRDIGPPAWRGLLLTTNMTLTSDPHGSQPSLQRGIDCALPTATVIITPSPGLRTQGEEQTAYLPEGQWGARSTEAQEFDYLCLPQPHGSQFRLLLPSQHP